MRKSRSKRATTLETQREGFECSAFFSRTRGLDHARRSAVQLVRQSAGAVSTRIAVDVAPGERVRSSRCTLRILREQRTRRWLVLAHVRCARDGRAHRAWSVQRRAPRCSSRDGDDRGRRVACGLRPTPHRRIGQRGAGAMSLRARRGSLRRREVLSAERPGSRLGADRASARRGINFVNVFAVRATAAPQEKRVKKRRRFRVGLARRCLPQASCGRS